MIDSSEYVLYFGYVLLCLVAIILQIKIQSTENILITTAEFKLFQWNYLFGYMGCLLGEILSVGSFYSTLISHSLTIQQITQLFLISILSITFFSLLLEIIDYGSKRMKCIASVILFSFATITLFSNHFDILIFGRILYGCGSVLLHSGFDSYLIHEHNSLGFPDDWLNNTFGRLVHSMCIVTMISGVVGQYVYSMFGPQGNLIFLCLLFAVITAFISNQWNPDIAGKRCMMNSFFQSVGQSVRAIRANTQTALVIVLSACIESTILLFSFYWAPWLSHIYLNSDLPLPTSEISSTTRNLIEWNTTGSLSLDQHSSTTSEISTSTNGPLPLMLVYSSLMTIAMIGHYLHTLALSTYGNDYIFQFILFVSLAGYLTAALSTSLSLSSISTIYFLSLVIQLCSGAYWPCVGFLRGKYILPEIRGVVISLTRVISFFLVFGLLWFYSNSPFLIFLGCGVLHLVAIYSLFTISQMESKLLRIEYSGNENDF